MLNKFIKKRHSNLRFFIILSIMFTLFITNHLYALKGYEILWNQFLTESIIEQQKRRKIITNLIDYESIRNSQNFTTLIRVIESTDINSFESTQHSLSFWINAYNIGVIKLILDNHPVNSLNDITDFYTIPVYSFNDQFLSLSDIRSKLSELDNLFYIFCLHNGTISGPDIWPILLTSENINSEIKSTAERYLTNSTKSIKLYPGVSNVYVSPIVSAFLDSLPPTQNRMEFIKTYVDIPQNKTYTIKEFTPLFDINRP